MTQPAEPAPRDPFGPLHAGSVSILESIRGYRGAGGSWVEVTVAVAAQFLATYVANAQQEEGQQ